MKLIKSGERISRREYFWNTVITTELFFLIIFLFTFIDETITGNRAVGTSTIIISLMIILLIISYIFSIKSTIKRLHDLGRPGSHYFFFLIPFYNIAFAFILLFQKGEGMNKYGPPVDKSKLPSNFNYVSRVVAVLLIIILTFKLRVNHQEKVITNQLQNIEVNDFCIMSNFESDSTFYDLYRVMSVSDSIITFQNSAYIYYSVSNIREDLRNNKENLDYLFWHQYSSFFRSELSSKKITQIIEFEELETL